MVPNSWKFAGLFSLKTLRFAIHSIENGTFIENGVINKHFGALLNVHRIESDGEEKKSVCVNDENGTIYHFNARIWVVVVAAEDFRVPYCESVNKGKRSILIAM